MKSNRENIIHEMRASRVETLRLYDWLREELDTRRIVHPGFRPMLWHLPHVGTFEEWWLLITLQGDPPLAPRYQVLFDPIKTPREESLDLPPRAEMEEYLARVRTQVELRYLGKGSAGLPSNKLLENDYVFHMVLEHEYQHQETLSYMLQMLPPDRKRKPEGTTYLEPPVPAPRVTPEMVKVPGGPFTLGASGEPFVYDNEGPPREVELAEFRIDRYPVTNAEYAEFLAGGGYNDRLLWSEAGWTWKQQNEIARPLYWSAAEPRETQEMFEMRLLVPDFPVTGVSWHEAQAYSRFVGKRLPSESEWEKAASREMGATGPGRKRRFPWGEELPSPQLCNFNGRFLGPTRVGAFPDGASPVGCLDMAGNVWEWTATTFSGYPGFKAHPYAEYSEIWFDGDHRVMKGGSWMTRAPLLRTSFRNFFRPGFRFAFAGFRCCS